MAGCRLRIADLPGKATWPQLAGVAAIAGIRFTVSLFVAGLAFTEPVATAEAKVGILVASAVAGIAGMALLKFVCKAPREAAT